MALPLTRNTTYAEDSQVLSADLNDLQDKVIDLHTGKHAAQEIVIPANSGSPLPGTGSTDWVFTNQGALHADAGADDFYIPIVLPVGSRITGIEVYVNGDTLKTVASRPEYMTAATGGITTLGSTQTSTLNNTDQTLTHAALNETVTAARCYQVKISGSAAGPASSVACRAIKVTYDRP